MSDNTKIVLSALLVGLFFLFNRIIPGFHTPWLSLTATFFPVILAAFIMGPLWAAAVGGLGDIVSALLVPRGAYFFGFTLSWILAGLIYGLFCHRKRNKSNVALLINLVIASLIVLVGERVLLTAGWIMMLPTNNQAFMAILWSRAIAFAILLPFQVAIMWATCRFLREPIDRFLVIEEDSDD